MQKSQSSERHVIWLPKQKLAYVRVPKAANSSIRFLMAKTYGITSSDDLIPNKDAFWARADPKDARSMTAEEYLEGPAIDSWCFSFVRHPVARLYSSWNNKVIENGNLSPGFERMDVVTGMSFDAFVERVAASPDDNCDIHVRSQASILLHNGRAIPNFIGQVERVNVLWRQVRFETRFRCGKNIGRLLKKNVRFEAKPEIAKSLSPETLSRIRDRYHDDFELFYPNM